MNRLKLFLLKLYLRLGLFFYFRRIHIEGIGNIPEDEPTLILANHRNALIDALLIAVNLPKYGYFLTRASVFKKPLISKLLRGINMIPVYRIRDGWSNLTLNSSIFFRCTELLNENNIVMIFPEGSHNLVRRVRPLSKGFTRIVFDFIESHPEKGLRLVPVGINYSLTTGFPDEVKVLIGDSIEVKADPASIRSERVRGLKEVVHKAMSELTVQIPETEYEVILKQLDECSADYLHPAGVNACIKNDLKDCPRRLDNHLELPGKISILLIKILYVLPYLIWRVLVKPKIIEKEFISTFRFATIVVLTPVYLLLTFIVLGFIAGWTASLLIIAILIIITILAVKL